MPSGSVALSRLRIKSGMTAMKFATLRTGSSLTTLLVLAARALFGGEMMFGFAVALLVGVAVGTYSSMYVAATTLLQLGVSKEDVMVPEREGADQEGLMP